MPSAPRRPGRPRAALVAIVLTALAAGACAGPAFDPSGPCSADGRAAGAYPALEALLPRTFDGRAPDSVDSGRNCTPASLGPLVTHGVTELRFAGESWGSGPDGGVSIAVFEAPGLKADWIHEFYETGARSARNGEAIETSSVTVNGQPGFRVDALNGESYQSVVDWQDGDRVRVVLVGSFIRESSKAQHEQIVQDAISTAGT
jgi:hypothetical protein